MDCFVGFEPVLVIVEIERDHHEDLLKDLIDKCRAPVIVIDRRNQTEGVTDHDEVGDLASLKMPERNDRKLPVSWVDSDLSVCLALV